MDIDATIHICLDTTTILTVTLKESLFSPQQKNKTSFMSITMTLEHYNVNINIKISFHTSLKGSHRGATPHEALELTESDAPGWSIRDQYHRIMLTNMAFQG
ncbi:hypothetical protein AcV7_004252 [Taiwanofungus camphoratus]|nr:hypothetical protein AcV7_004252 [Antrodia cinnamomea]